MKTLFIAFYLFICIKSELEKCFLNDAEITKEWFLWGQLYSYCMYLKVENGQQSTAAQIDENCSTLSCSECLTVCKIKQQFDLTSCQLGCNKSTACQFGCQFYSNITAKPKDQFQVKDESQPYVNSTFEVDLFEQKSLTFSFQWPKVFSKNSMIQSIYLITFTIRTYSSTNSYDRIQALVTENNINVTDKLLCALYDEEYIYSFQLNIYPINYNGYDESIKLSSDVTKFKSIRLLSYLLYAPTNSTKSLDINWNVEWTYSKDFEVIGKEVKLTPLYKCDFSTQKKLSDPQKSFTFILTSNNGNISFRNDENDGLSKCILSVEASLVIDECSKSVSTITLSYPGCAYFPSYPVYCNFTATPELTVAPTNVTYNISGLYYLKMNGSNVSFPFYDIVVSWIKPTSPFLIISYKLSYFVSSSIKNDTEFVIGNIEIENIPLSTTSFNFTVPAGKYLNIYIFGYTENQNFNDRQYLRTRPSKYFSIKTSEVPTETPTTQSNFTPPPTNNKTSTILAAVLVPVLVVVLIFAIVLLVLRIRGKNLKSKTFNADNYMMQKYLETGGDLKADEWEISPKSFDLDRQIGEGAFGTVFIAKMSASDIAKTKYASQQSGASLLGLKANSVNVAVKLLKEGASQLQFDDFIEEISLMKEIRFHANIVNMIGCSTLKSPLCLIVEFMENGDLLQYLRKNRNKICTSNNGESTVNVVSTQDYRQTLNLNETTTTDNSTPSIMPNETPLQNDGVITPNDLLKFAWQVASGMEYLSSIKLVHRDLAARNILVGAKKNVKISDFGLTRKVNDEMNYMSKKSRRLPVKWMSVEAIFDQMFTSCSDVWAYGVVLFEIVTLGGTPYPSISNRELLALLKTGYRMERPENCSDVMYDIMMHCWNEDPLQRPTFTELRDHLDGIMSQNDDYFSFDIDKENNYYNAASFNSLPSESGDEVLEEEIFQKPMQVKSIDKIKGISDEATIVENQRHTNPQDMC